MYALSTAVTLLLAASASVHAAPTASSNGAFSLMALRSASPLHFQPVNANGGKFWILKAASTYCPSPPVDAATCKSSTKNVTALVSSADTTSGAAGALALNDLVPGGQQVFVDPADGALAFTQAHSASMPTGALTAVFTRKDGYLSTSKGALVACPDGQGHYQVKVALKGKDTKNCLGFNAKTIDTTAQAWQYA